MQKMLLALLEALKNLHKEKKEGNYMDIQKLKDQLVLLYNNLLNMNVTGENILILGNSLMFLRENINNLIELINESEQISLTIPMDDIPEEEE